MTQRSLTITSEKPALTGMRTNLTYRGQPGFIILPPGAQSISPRQWIWYAPTRGEVMPNEPVHFYIQRALDAGMAFAGIDIGESYGNPAGVRLFAEFHAAITEQFHLCPRAVLFPHSRGGLMFYNWASRYPQFVARILGIYTVCDLRSYPGLAKAAPAYELSEEKLASRLHKFNPIELLAPLAKAQIPILHIHGDQDELVPIGPNSSELARRYHALGGPMKLITVSGKGHGQTDEFFKSQDAARFLAGL